MKRIHLHGEGMAVAILLLCIPVSAISQREAVTSGNWSHPATWSGGIVPAASDDVTLTTTGVTVTIDALTAECNNLTLTGSGSSSNSGTLLQFAPTGTHNLIVHGSISITGGAGGGSGDRGGRPKLSSNGNPDASLTVYGDLRPRCSNTTSNGNAGLNMNEGTVFLFGGSTDTIRNGSGFRLANLVIGDGIVSKTVVWDPTSKATLSVQSVTVRSGSTFYLGCASDTIANTLGSTTSSVVTLKGGIHIEPGGSLVARGPGFGSSTGLINLDGGGIVNDGTLDLHTGFMSRHGTGTEHRIEDGSGECSYVVSIGFAGGAPSSTQTFGGSRSGNFGSIQVHSTDTLRVEQDIVLAAPADTLRLDGHLIEVPDATIGGTIAAERTLGQTDHDDFGGVGFSLGTTGVASGVTTVYRTTGRAQTGNGHTSILRSFDVVPAVNSNLNAVIDFRYDAGELAGQRAASLQLWRSEDGGTVWEFAGGIVDTVLRDIHLTGVGSLSRWTAADAGHGLGVNPHQYAFEERWNLVSLPGKVPDCRVTSLFPGTVSHAYAFDGGYIQKDSLQIGAGYWLKFPEAETLTIPTAIVQTETIVVKAGWNLIGSPGMAVPVTSIMSGPGNLRMSEFFGYESNYAVAETLRPAHGYWVKARSGGGYFIIGGSSEGSGRTFTPPRNGVIGSITIRDGAGHLGMLHLLDAENGTPDAWDLPPPPPGNAFDVRFSTGRLAEIVPEGKKAEFSILVRGGVPPFVVKGGIREESDRIFQVSSAGENPVDLRVALERRHPAASDLALHDPFPNPFNPATTITYALVRRTTIRLSVIDMLGREVAVMKEGELTAGVHHDVWNGTDNEGRQVSSGLYIISLRSGGELALSKKVVYLR